MIKHVVLFKFKETLKNPEKETKITAIKDGLEALNGKIDTLKKIEVGISCNAKETYDMALTTEFDNMEGLSTYATHPEHLKVLALIKEILEERACVDYEV